MSAINRAALVALLNSKVLTGGNQTTAQGLRDTFNSIIESVVNIIDDKDANGGYLGINSVGIVDVTKIQSSSPLGYFLRDDGTWQPVGSAGTPTLQQVLTTGNVATKTIETTKFIKTGGLSTQFLKADGSVDSNVYGVGDALTTNPLSQFAATTSSQLAGVISDETGSGSLVFGTSPTFTTNITTPLINGTSGTLQIGTTDLVNIGNKTTTSQRLVRIGQDTAWIDIGSQSGATARPAIYFNVTTPDTTNFIISSHQTTGDSYFNGKTSARFLANGNIVMSMFANYMTFAPSFASSGAVTTFEFTVPNHTAQTASTNIPNFKVNGGIKSWSPGTTANQYWNYFTSPTASGASSTLTNSFTLFVEAATVGTASITNNYAAGFNGTVNVIGSLYSTGFRLVDGTQALNKVLISDANGNASWATSSTGYAKSINNIAVNTTAAATANTDYYYFCTATLTLTLPTAVGNTNTYNVKLTGGTLTINTTSSQTIDGSLTIVTSVLNTSFTVISDGTNWQII
jgi:hypothetical protein